MPLPLPDPEHPDPMRWAAAANASFALAEGVFVGPYGGGGRASVGAFPRRTSQLFARVADTGEVPVVTDLEKADAAADLAHWKARCVVLAGHPRYPALRETAVQLFGQPTRVADVDVWRVAR